MLQSPRHSTLPAILLGPCSGSTTLLLLLRHAIRCTGSTCNACVACVAIVLGSCVSIQRRRLLLVVCLGCCCGCCCCLRLCGRCSKVSSLHGKVEDLTSLHL